MRYILSYLIVLCGWAAPAFTQNPPNSAPKTATVQSDSQLIQQIEDDLLNAENSTKVETFERVLADEYVNLIQRGVGPGKAEIMKNLREHAGQAPPYSVEKSDMHIYVLGETAVAAYVRTYIAKENGNVAHEDTTHIFVKDHGAWKLRISRASIRKDD